MTEKVWNSTRFTVQDLVLTFSLKVLFFCLGGTRLRIFACHMSCVTYVYAMYTRISVIVHAPTRSLYNKDTI